MRHVIMGMIVGLTPFGLAALACAPEYPSIASPPPQLPPITINVPPASCVPSATAGDGLYTVEIRCCYGDAGCRPCGVQ
jgi:hypothetical protein